ncbi:MAG TPA: nucleotide sugar dehydrogenase [Candidatus Saccharimonadales bacterium]|nr:nucleotide sugar dehydrogenase [Candidatus Saccharimonadales bacterium]
MQIVVYGAGYLGTVLSACLADFGTPIVCCDSANDKVLSLAQGRIPFYEKNLEEIVKRNVRAGRLTYSTETDAQVARSQVVYLAQDDPEETETVALRLAPNMLPGSLLLICTPTPVGTVTQVAKKICALGYDLAIVSHPLSLTEGCAVEDFNWPDRLLFGTSSPQAVSTLKIIYRPLVMRGTPVIVTNSETAELVREAATAFIATKISFINEMAALCEHVNADALDLSLALGLDKRIAPRCLQAGVGLGGTYVESDICSLSALAQRNGVQLQMLNAAQAVAHQHAERTLRTISGVMPTLRDKRLGLLGLAIKPHTSSIAGSSSVALARQLVENGAVVRAYDPFAMSQAQRELEQVVSFCDSAYTAAEGVDALIVATGWPEFRSLDFVKMKPMLRRPLIVDTKNLLDPERLRGIGYEYMGVGRMHS